MANESRLESARTALDYVTQNDCHNLAKFCATSAQIEDHLLEEVDIYGNTALLKACFQGKAEAVCILLRFQANIRAINYFGQNALTLATHFGCSATVCELLKYRSYEDFNLSSMIPPLCVAILKGHQNLVKMFQEMYPSANDIQTVHGLSPDDLTKMAQRHQQHQLAK